ncbi:MAG TPA: hypothetical protein DEP53_00030 [Bacteroidetes bacterium]|nr:hypothetical protein [Bacteroidota bacterium]
MRSFFINVTGKSIVRMSGRDSLDLLQRISTNDLLLVKSGEKVQTILTNDKGRIVDVVSVIPHGFDNLLLAGSNPTPAVLKGWIEKFVIMEDITVTDVTADYYQLLVFDLEPNVQDFYSQLGGDFVFEKWGSSTLLRLLGDTGSIDSVIRKLGEWGIGKELPGLFEKYRISNGIPAFPSELSTTYNPLEAGLDGMISWTKGCYVGQEVIARLDTYKKVQRKIVRLRLEKHPGGLPAAIMSREHQVGLLTSASRLDDAEGLVGLGYIKTSFLQTADELSIRGGTEPVRVTLM